MSDSVTQVDAATYPNNSSIHYSDVADETPRTERTEGSSSSGFVDNSIGLVDAETAEPLKATEVCSEGDEEDERVLVGTYDQKDDVMDGMISRGSMDEDILITQKIYAPFGIGYTCNTLSHFILLKGNWYKDPSRGYIWDSKGVISHQVEFKDFSLSHGTFLVDNFGVRISGMSYNAGCIGNKVTITTGHDDKQQRKVAYVKGNDKNPKILATVHLNTGTGGTINEAKASMVVWGSYNKCGWVVKNSKGVPLATADRHLPKWAWDMPDTYHFVVKSGIDYVLMLQIALALGILNHRQQSQELQMSSLRSSMIKMLGGTPSPSGSKEKLSPKSGSKSRLSGKKLGL